MDRRLTWACAALFALAIAGCGDDDGPGPMVDAGADGSPGGDAGRDAGDRDAAVLPPLGTCAMPAMVMGTIGTVMADFDSTGGPAGALDLGDCGTQTGASTRTPQHVVAYRVPGTGVVAIDFTTANDGTLADYDTVIQVRRGMCAATPEPVSFPPSCFDDTSRMDYRSTGSVTAMGGDTIYFVIAGYSYAMPGMGEVTEGMGRLEITARTAAAPTATAADIRVFDSRTEIEVTGGDADGDAVGAVVTFLDAAGMPVDLDGSGAADALDDFVAYFDADLTGMTSFTAVSTVTDFDMTTTLTQRIRTAMATQARVQAFDGAYATSTPPLTVTLRALTEVGLGIACDATHVCSRELSCDGTSMTCVTEAAHATACTGATPITLAFPTGSMATTTTVTGMILASSGIFEGTCGGTGPEAIYTLAVPGTGGVPTAPVDILVTTDVMETAMDVDTVVHVRGTCGEPASEPTGACNDDLAMDNFHSSVEIRDATARTYAIFADLYGDRTTTAATAFGLKVTYRPVLAAGAACDPMGVQNRCSAGDCPAGATPVCP